LKRFAGRVAGWILLVCSLALTVVVFGLHSTPSYGVETDLLGDLVPTARALRAGRIVAENFEFKGPGYPLMLAAVGTLGWGDWIAARVLNVASAAAGAWFAFLVARRFAGPQAGLFVLLGLFLNPVWLRAGVEAGTDMPAFALSLAATWLVMSGRGRWSWFASGLVAGYALLTRYNAAFLPAAAAIVLATAPDPAGHPQGKLRAFGARFGLYIAGFVLPLAAWAFASRAVAGTVLHNRNYLNIAFEIYGQGLNWDMFWTNAAGRFHSLLDVLLLDPGRAARVLARNAASHWLLDIRTLVPIGLGIPAVVGMLLVWPRRSGALGIAAHFVLAYLVLTTVFYAPRFFLYLIPFYLLGTSSLLFHFPAGLRGFLVPRSSPDRESRRRKPLRAPRRRAAAGAPPKPTATQARRWQAPLRWGIATVLLAISGWLAVKDVGELIRSAPDEVRDAAEILRRRGPSGARVMARKPHVPYFAGMDYVAMPEVGTLLEVVHSGRETRSDYLFFSGLETSLRPQFLLLADSALVLPGLDQIAWHPPPDGFYALYRFTGEPIDTAQFLAAVVDHSIAFATRNPSVPKVQQFTGTVLLDLQQTQRAIEFLERAYDLDPADATTVSRLALAYFSLGDYQRAAQECERAIALARVSPNVHGLLGVSLAMQGRWSDAAAALERASELEPTNPTFLFQVGVVALVRNNAAEARRALDQCVALMPGMTQGRDRVLAAFASGAGPDLGQSLVLRATYAMLTHGDLTQIAADLGPHVR